MFQSYYKWSAYTLSKYSTDITHYLPTVEYILWSAQLRRKKHSDSRWISKCIWKSLGPGEKKLALVQSSYEINTDCLSMYLFI